MAGQKYKNRTFVDVISGKSTGIAKVTLRVPGGPIRIVHVKACATEVACRELLNAYTTGPWKDAGGNVRTCRNPVGEANAVLTGAWLNTEFDGEDEDEYLELYNMYTAWDWSSESKTELVNEWLRLAEGVREVAATLWPEAAEVESEE